MERVCKKQEQLHYYISWNLEGSHMLLVRKILYNTQKKQPAMTNNAVVHTEIYEERYVTGTQSIGIQNNHTHV